MTNSMSFTAVMVPSQCLICQIAVSGPPRECDMKYDPLRSTAIAQSHNRSHFSFLPGFKSVCLVAVLCKSCSSGSISHFGSGWVGQSVSADSSTWYLDTRSATATSQFDRKAGSSVGPFEVVIRIYLFLNEVIIACDANTPWSALNIFTC